MSLHCGYANIIDKQNDRMPPDRGLSDKKSSSVKGSKL